MRKRIFTSKKLIAFLLLLTLLVSVLPTAALGADLDSRAYESAAKGDIFADDASEDGALYLQKADPSQYDLTGLRDLPKEGTSARALVASSFEAGEFTEEELDYVDAYAEMLADPVGMVDIDGKGSESKYVFVWLQDLPEALERIYQREGRHNQRYEEGRASARRARGDIRASHNRDIVYEYSLVFSGFALEATVAELEQIAEMPGVFAITEVTYDHMDYIADPNYTTIGNGGARELMGIGDLHAAGIDGTNVKVGVIDSGIDMNHPDLKDAYKGGYNFAPRTTANPTGRNPLDPENNTPDGNHGTHVSGIIASQGLVSLGVAPGVDLYMAQVFTPSNPNSAASADTTAALEAFSGGNPTPGTYSNMNLPKVDVVNMSLGNDANTAYEAGHVARNNAVLAGVMVVNSAGNNAYATNNTTDRKNYTLGSGGVSLPISVAASQYGGNPILSYEPLFSNNAGDTGTVNFFCENGDSALAGVFRNGSFGSLETRIVPYGPVRAADAVFDHPYQEYVIEPLIYIEGKGYELYYACASNVPTPGGTTGSDMTTAEITALNNMPEGSLSGKILVVNRGQAFFEYKCQALRLGAAGLIVINRDESVIGNLNIGSETSAKDMLIFSAPASFKKTLYDLVQGGETAYLDPGPLNKIAHIAEPAAFSSIGPVNETAEIKPDVIAPGWDILSTDLGGEYTSMGGTSMSSPWVAGVAALVKQQFPNATPAEIKARIMNTADQDVIKPLSERYSNPGNYFDRNGTEMSVFEQGAGFVNPKRATDKNEAFITVMNYDIPTGATSKATFDEAQMASFSFGPTMAGTTSKTLTATVHGGTVDGVEVVYNHDTRYSNKNLDLDVEVFYEIDGDTLDVWLEIGAETNTNQVNGGNLYEGYIIVTVGENDYVLPWATRVGEFVEPESDYWLVYFDRPVQAVRGNVYQDFSPFSSQNLIFFMFEGKTIADSVTLRTTTSQGRTTYYLDLYLIDQLAGRLSHRISVNLGTDTRSTLKLSDFIDIGATYFVTWNGQANAINTQGQVAGTLSNVPKGAYNVSIPFGSTVRYYGVLGMVMTDTRPTITIGFDDEDVTLTEDSYTLLEYAYGVDEVTISGQLYSAATQLAADMGFCWAGDYLWLDDEIYELDQSYNVLIDAITGWELEFFDERFGVSHPWLCDEEGYFSITLPLNEDGYFFPEDICPSGIVYCADAFDASHPWQGSTVYMSMLYGCMASYVWCPLEYSIPIEVESVELENGIMTAQFVDFYGNIPLALDEDKLFAEIFKDGEEIDFVYEGYDAETGIATWTFEPFSTKVYEPWFLTATVAYDDYDSGEVRYDYYSSIDAEYAGVYITDVTADASIKKQSGNKNDLTIVVKEYYSDGSIKSYSKLFSIDNNAAGTYTVDEYNVYVDTKGNDQIRACYISAYLLLQ